MREHRHCQFQIKMYDFKECKAIALDFRLKTEMFLINERWSIPKLGRDTTVTNLGDRDRHCLPITFDLGIAITLKMPV